MKDSLKISQKLSPRKYALFTGTLLLTSTGLITRVLGFFYRIFLSRTIGAEGLDSTTWSIPYSASALPCALGPSRRPSPSLLPPM